MRVTEFTQRKQTESTIALINVVFLMLIFFLIAGTLVSQLDQDVELAVSPNSDIGEPPVDALFISKDGTLRSAGRQITIEDFISRRGVEDENPVLVAADHRAEASSLVELLADLRARGVSNISIVTRKP
ncbi:MAG: biopolymer transporter ExbD [Pseudomonadota bacterium]